MRNYIIEVQGGEIPGRVHSEVIWYGFPNNIIINANNCGPFYRSTRISLLVSVTKWVGKPQGEKEWIDVEERKHETIRLGPGSTQARGRILN